MESRRTGRFQFFFIAAVWGMLVAAGCGKVDPRWDEPRRSRPREGPPEAVELLLAEVKKNPASSEARLRLATEYLKRDRLREAAEEFRQAQNSSPETPLPRWDCPRSRLA
jgi:hypothetical protein